MSNIYQEKGYTGRREYLMALAEENEVDYNAVFELAAILGPNEDFDGLVTTVEDYAMMEGNI